MLGRALAACGNNVRVIGFLQDHTEEFERDGDVSIWRLPVPAVPLGWAWARRSLYRKVAEWARNGEIDLVEVPDYQGLAAYWPKLNVPLVARMHGSSTYFGAEMGEPVNALSYRLERASLQRADFLCSTSRYTADRSTHLFKLGKRRSEVIYNTVTIPEQISMAERDRNSVVFSGTVSAKKGIVSLMRAWPLVVAKSPAARLHVYGKDTRTESGKSLWERLLASLDSHTRDTVHFHGHVDSATLRHALCVAGMAVFPSYSEAFALAPMEAMAESCPTIFTRRSSGRELIEDHQNGLLIDPDWPEEIAAAILSLIEDEDLARSLGRAGREHIVRDFSPPTVVHRNENYYHECIRAFRELPNRVALADVAEEARL
jgi:glycosyltransferase involved in cell wall biosynthesis